jgi:hypothetical protein
VEGIANTEGVVLLRADKEPKNVLLGGNKISAVEFSEAEKLLWIKFPNEALPRELSLSY